MDEPRAEPLDGSQPRARVDESGRAARPVAGPGSDRGLATMAWALGVAASFMLAAAFGALWYATRADLAATRENAARLEAMVRERDQKAALASQEAVWLKDARLEVALLKGLEGSPAARGKLLWHPGTRQGILWVSGLAPLPPERCYQLWVFAGDQPVPAGVFDSKGGDEATVVPVGRQEALGQSLTRFTVTVEPKGGVPLPTGAIVLAGERS